MNIGIRLKSSELSRDLARRISELYSGVSIIIMGAEGDEKTDVLIDDECDLDLPVSLLMRNLLSEYEERTGLRIGVIRRYGHEILSVESATGGSGVSSVSTVLGRHFAGREGKKVLIVENIGQDDLSYSEPLHPPERSRRELEFSIAKGRKICLSKYYYRDRYGPFFISLRAGVSCISEIVESEGEFDMVIFSGIKGEELPDCAKRIYVSSSTDRRSGVLKGACPGIKVLNRSKESGFSEDIVRIAEDEESFSVEGDRVIIRMDGDFARGVDILYRKLRGLI